MDKPDLLTDLAIKALVSIPISKIVSRSTEVVPFGVKAATNNIRLNKHSRDITVLNNEIISQLVGHLLGDGSIHYTRTSVTPYFVFTPFGFRQLKLRLRSSAGGGSRFRRFY